MSELLPLVDFSIMASPGQKKGACGHIMASFDKHSRCARCREKGQGDDPCVQNLQCDFCSVLTPEQVFKLSTPTYKLRKEKAKAKEVLVDPSSVVVLDTQPEQEPAVSVSSAPDLSLPVPQFKKDLQELDEKWATRMARLEALITLGHRSSPSAQNPTFSPVKVPVSHAAPAGALSQTPFFVSTSASSGPAGPAVGPDEPRDQDFSFADRQSPLQNLYPEAEPMFKHPAPVATVSSAAAMSASSQSAFQQPSSGSGPVTFRDVNPQETFEEGELSDAEESPDLETSDPDRVLSEDQNYRETVRGVRAFMGWTHIPDLEFSPQSRTDNPWAGHRSQPVGKISVDLPPEDWLCRKLETLNLVLIEGYPSKSSDPGGLHVDQFLRPPKSQSRWYGIHPAEPTDPTRPGKSVNSWPNDAAKINSSFPRISTISSASPQPPSRPLSQDTMRKWEKAAKESSYICNQSAGFYRCITKIQDAFQEQLHILQSELKKGKSSVKAQGALDELLYLSSFNQNVSFAMESVVTRNSFVSVPTNVSYHVVCRVPTVTRWQSQKKDVRPKSKIKSQIKCVKSASFVGHFVSAPNVPNVPNVASVQPVGGRLQSFWEIWAHKGANPKVVSILKEGYVLPFKVRPPLVRDPLIVSGYANPIRDSHLQAAVQALIEKKAVERVRVQTSLAFFNRLFIVPKLNHKWRPILDLSTLNQFLCVKTFKMETPETIRTSLQQEEWVTSLDFSDAYFHIPIHFTSRKFLRFHFQNQSYQFRALPFGLSTAPMEFTGVVKEVKLMAQSQGIRIHQYLDDWLIRAPTKESCHQGTQSLLALCQELGWMVNMQKSELEPQQVFDFVGYQYDLLNGVVRPTQNRWEALQQKITVLLQNRSCRVRTFMSLIGLLTATEKQVTLGRLHMRPIQWHLKKHWRVPESLEKEIPIPRSLHQYLQWWTQEENVLKGQPLHPLRHAVQIFTDASKEGWGAHLGDFTASGTWSVSESKLHINFLELKAVLLALKRFQHLVQGKVVLIATDNTTVVAYINKEGGMRSGSLCALLWRLLCWCSLNQIVLKARHIPGRLNVIADKLSRQRQVIQTEWSLHQETFDLLCQTWHYPRVDMFATRYNCKLVQFVSPIPDPKAWSVDALTLSWEDLDMYLFPPVSLMGKVVSKLSDHWYRRAILIAPGWPNMPWFWDLVELSARVPLCLPHHPDLVTQPFKSGWPERKEDTPLCIWDYWPITEELTFQNGVRHRVVITKAMHPEMLLCIHASHLGVESCLRKARDIVYWPHCYGHGQAR